MTKLKHRTIPMLTAGALCLGAACAQAAEPASAPTPQEMQAQIQQLQAQVQQLQAQQQTISAKDVDATVDSVLNDADRHSQMLEAGDSFYAGYKPGTGFVVQDPSGDFLLHPWYQMQARYVASIRENQHANGDTDTSNGFEIRRMKIGIDGTMFHNIAYEVIWKTTQAGGGVLLEDAWAKIPVATNLALRVGQFKDPFAHEGLVSSKWQMAAERSYMDDIFGFADNYVEGATLVWDPKSDIRAEGGFTNGISRNDQNYQSPPTNFTNWGAAARVEYKVEGDWADYNDFSAEDWAATNGGLTSSDHKKKDLLVIGGAVDYTEAGKIDGLYHTVDVQWKTGQLAVYGAGIGRYGTSSASGHPYDWGGEGMVSYAIDHNWEPFVRYDVMDVRFSPTGARPIAHEITAGVNYYLHGKFAKFTLDGGYLPNGAPVSDANSGVIKTTGKHNEFFIRGQFQLII